MTKTKKRKIYFGIFWILIVTSFIFFSIILVASANGYHFNTKTLKLQKTSMIIINGQLDSPTIYINGKVKKTGFSRRFGQLVPGRYEVLATKSNYQDWSKVVYLIGGQALTLNDVTLYLKTPDVTQITENSQSIENIDKNFQSQKNDIDLLGGEIHFNGQLITRFSQEIGGAIYDQSNNHFYFQFGDEIRVMDFDGSNNVLLFKLPKNETVKFYVNNKNLFYVLDNKIYKATIR